jgi:hypothetical protein
MPPTYEISEPLIYDYPEEPEDAEASDEYENDDAEYEEMLSDLWASVED